MLWCTFSKKIKNNNIYTCNFEYLKNKNIKHHLSPFCIKYFNCYFGTTGPSNIAKDSRSTNTAQGSFHFGPKMCNSDECHGLSVLRKFWLRDSTAHLPCFFGIFRDFI
jgi:hypothetical protein